MAKFTCLATCDTASKHFCEVFQSYLNWTWITPDDESLEMELASRLWYRTLNEELSTDIFLQLKYPGISHAIAP